MNVPDAGALPSVRELDAIASPGASLRHLLERVWGPGRNLPGEYPLLFGRGGGDFVALALGGAPVAACGYLERDLVTPHGELPVALLGSVGTHPDLRGRGFAALLLARAVERARRAGRALVLLWPMDGSVYRSSGFVDAGCEWNVVLPTDLDLGHAQAVRRAGPVDAPALLALYDRHPVRVRRTPDEMAALLDCPGMETRVALREGRPVAYACRGRGGDLAPCVHEWAGEPGAVLALVSGLARDGADDPRYLLAPDWTSPVTEALLDAGCAALTRPLGMARLADRAAACRFLAARTGRTLVPSANGALVDGPRGPVALTDAQLLTALLPPPEPGDALAAVADALGAEPADLPSYGFCWGLDSV